jgi:hypothetical protein
LDYIRLIKALVFLIKSFSGDSKGGGFSKEPSLAAGGTGVAGGAGLTFFELTDITAHPVEKMPGNRSARRAIYFSECPCGTRVQLEKVP